MSFKFLDEILVVVQLVLVILFIVGFLISQPADEILDLPAELPSDGPLGHKLLHLVVLEFVVWSHSFHLNGWRMPWTQPLVRIF